MPPRLLTFICRLRFLVLAVHLGSSATVFMTDSSSWSFYGSLAADVYLEKLSLADHTAATRGWRGLP
jgi:hypothetical protein